MLSLDQILSEEIGAGQLKETFNCKENSNKKTFHRVRALS